MKTLFLLLTLLLTLPAAQAQQAPLPRPDTVALWRRYRAAAAPDTARLRAGVVLLRAYGDAYPAVRARPEALAQALLPLARRLRQPRFEHEILNDLYVRASHDGQRAAALGYVRQRLALARQQRDTVHWVGALFNLGQAYLTDQNMAEARRCLEQADRLAQGQPVPATVVGLLLGTLTNVYWELNQPALARRTFRRALPVVRGLGQPLNTFALLAAYANGLRLAQPDSALPPLREALALATRLRDPYALAYAHLLLTQTHQTRRDWPQVQAQARLTLRYARRSNTPDYAAEALTSLAESLRHQGQGTAAYDTLRAAQVMLDTLRGQEARQDLNALQARNGAERQQAQIAALQQERRLAAQTRELVRLRYRQQLAGGGLLLLLLLGGGVAQLRRYRRRQAAREAAHEATLRTQLSADLHDDVGHLLTHITMQSSLLCSAAHSPAHTLERLESLAATARQAAQQMSDVVWGIGPDSLTLHQLLARMRDHAQEVLPPAGLDVAFAVAPDLPNPVLPPLLRHHLYLVYKEALHNVVKHAGASLVQVRLAHGPAGLALTIADDGRGHDGRPRPGGHGLPSMQARAEALGGTVRYPAQAVGFALCLELPL